MPSKLAVVVVALLLAVPTVIFWLYLVIVKARVSLLCPEECQCGTVGYEVSCYGPSITTVPSIRLTDLRVLWLVGNNITSIERDTFVALTGLEGLRVLNCTLRTIEVGAFNGVPELSELIMWNNELSEIIPGTFENLNNLERIDLGNNRLQHLDSDVFSGLVKLKFINLAGNRLQYLHPNTFIGLPNIRHISLHNNSALQIPTENNFVSSSSLSKLDISYCNVSSLSVQTFTNVSALEWLGLSYNNLRTVDVSILKELPKLSELYLFGNRLQCDCQLKEVWQWCEGHNIRTVSLGEVPQCETPSEVKGMRWGVLEKGECSQGNISYHGDYRSTSYSDNDVESTNSYENDVKDLKQHHVPIYSFPFIFGTLGNIIVIIIIVSNKDMRNVPNMYILNLAVSDIIHLIVLFTEACANIISPTWLRGEFICALLPFSRRLSVGLSAYSVAVLSIHRYRAIVTPLHVHVSAPPTWRVTAATIFGVWFVSALFAVPSAISKYMCQKVVSIRLAYYRHEVTFKLVASCVVPLCVIAFTYIMTALHLMKSSRPISDGKQNPQMNTRRNTARIVLGLTVVFLISYVPFHVFWIYTSYSDKGYFYYEKITDVMVDSVYKFQYLYLISTSFLFVNPCLNPVALFLTSSQFRHHLKRYLTYFCKSKSTPADTSLTKRN
jgi:hypothetical protein